MLANMDTEALLAELRGSIPYSKQKPSVESLGYAGLLTQLHKQFEFVAGRNELIR